MSHAGFQNNLHVALIMKVVTFFALNLLSFTLAAERDTLVRVQLESDGTKFVTMVDKIERVVNFHLDAEGGIIDCRTLKRRVREMAMINFEVC